MVAAGWRRAGGSARQCQCSHSPTQINRCQSFTSSSLSFLYALQVQRCMAAMLPSDHPVLSLVQHKLSGHQRCCTNGAALTTIRSSTTCAASHRISKHDASSVGVSCSRATGAGLANTSPSPLTWPDVHTAVPFGSSIFKFIAKYTKQHAKKIHWRCCRAHGKGAAQQVQTVHTAYYMAGNAQEAVWARQAPLGAVGSNRHLHLVHSLVVSLRRLLREHVTAGGAADREATLALQKGIS